MSQQPKTPLPPARFTVDRDVLVDALEFAVKYLPTKPAVPVLSGVLLTATDTGVTVTAFDYEITTRVDLAGATAQAHGSTLVPGRQFRDMAKKLPKKAGAVTIDVAGVTAAVTCGQARFTLATLPVEDYPTPPDMPPAVGTIDAAMLMANATAVGIAAGKEETLPMMTGIHVAASKNTLTMMATDRYRLGVRDLPWSGPAFEALVPARTLLDTAKRFGKVKGATVEIRHYAQEVTADARSVVKEALFALVCGPYSMTTRVIDSKNYPPVRSLIPPAFMAHAELDRLALIETVDRVAMACDKGTPVLLTFEHDRVTVEAGNIHKRTGAEPVDCVYTVMPADERAKVIKAAVKEEKAKYKHSQPEVRDELIKKATAAITDAAATADAGGLTVGLNPAYLVDALKSAGTQRVLLQIVDRFKPMLVQPCEDGQSVPNVWHLLMPIRVDGGTAPAKDGKPAGGEQPAAPVAVEAPAPVEAAATPPVPEKSALAARIERLTPHMTQGPDYIRAVVEGVGAAMRKIDAGGETWEIDLIEAEVSAGFRERDDLGRARRGEPIAAIATMANLAVSLEAFDLAQAGEHEQALAAIDRGEQLAPGVVLGVRPDGIAYGWPELRAACEALRAKSLGDGQAAEPVTADEDGSEAVETVEPETVEPVEAVADASLVDEVDVTARLAALDLPEHIIAAAVAAAKAAADGIVVLDEAPSVTAPVAVEPAAVEPVAAGEAAQDGGRRYPLPAGAPVRRSAKALRAALAASQRGAEQPVRFTVYGEREARSLRVVASVASGEVWALVDATVAGAVAEEALVTV